MAMRLQPTPEGALIRRVRESIRPRLSVPAIAKRSGISEVTWGNVERGYKSGGRGQPPQRVRGSKQLIAHMSYELGITPGDLESVGRDDAAEVLREMQGPDPDVVEVQADAPNAVVLVPVPPDWPESEREELRQWAIQMAEILEARRRGKDDGT